MEKNLNLFENQNSEENLKLLASQRQLYSDAKLLTMINFIISILFPAFIVCLNPIFEGNHKILMILKIVSILIIVFLVPLDNWIKTKKERAAIIQNKFDYDIYELDWKEDKQGDLVDIEEWVLASYNKFLKKGNVIDELKDWYPKEYFELPLQKRRLYCQKCNVYWDYNLKKEYNRLIRLIGSLVIILILILTVFNYELTVMVFFYNIFVPIFPVIHYLYKTNQNINNDIKTLDKIKMLIAGTSEYISNKQIDDNIILNKILNIQEEIFKHRKNGIVVIDFLYNKMKNLQEQEARNYAKKVISKKDD
jgi:hypothetical protein